MQTWSRRNWRRRRGGGRGGKGQLVEEEDDEEEDEDAEEERSDKSQQPSPGRWGKKGRLNGFKRNTTAHVFFLKDGIGCRNLCTRKMYGII
jgi:hypothetical protein